MANPWEMDWSAQRNGDAVIAPPDPYKQAAEQRAQGAEVRAQEDQAMQRDNQRIAQERLDLSRAAEARQARNDELGTEGERTAGFLAGRVVNGIGRMADAISRNKEAQAPTLGVEAVRGIFGDTAANYLTDAERQEVRAAQIDILDSALTLGTGAAYTREQIEGYREAYFPQLGDSEKAIESKRQALKSLLENAAVKAGKAAPEIEAAISQIEAIGGEEEGGAQTDDEGLQVQVSYDPNDPNSPPTVDPFGGQRETFGNAGATLDAAATLGKQGISLGLSDEAAGIGGALVGIFNGDGIQGGYVKARDAERQKIEAARDQLGWGGTALEFAGAGGGVKVANGLRNTLGIGRSLAATGQPIARASVQNALTRQATRQGGALGALGGYGYGEGAEGSAVNALLGAGGGALVGNVAQRAGNALSNRAGNVAGREVQAAADDLSIDTIPAMTGGTTTRRLTSGARQGFVSDRPIASRVSRMEEQGLAARDMATEGLEEGLDAADAGEVVRSAANVFARRTSQIGGKLYERAGRRAGDAAFPTPTAVERADRWLGELSQSVKGQDGTIYKEIAKLRETLADGEFSLMAIPRTRDEFRAQIQERGLRGSTLDTAMKDILDGVEQDILGGLRESGRKGAANAFETATRFWAKRVQTIDEVLEPILGKNSPKSGEQIVTALEGMAKPKTGNSARLRQLFDAMPQREASAVRATFINRLGRPTAGSAQNADEAGFSFNTFLTNWNNISPRAKSVLFPKESRQVLDKLATVSRGMKEAGSAMNSSNTAGALVSQGAISGALWWLADPFTAIGAAGGQYAIGRLLASPKVARVLAGAPKADSPRARSVVASRLGNVAKAEPALAGDIETLRKSILGASNDNAARGVPLAASEQDAEEGQ